MFALFIPWLLLILLFVVVILIFKKRWRASLLMAAIILLVNWWGESIPFRLWCKGSINESAKLRIICFNIDGSSGDNLEKSKSVRDFVKQYSPDIVFVAEFNEQYPKPLDSLLKEDFAYTTYPNHLFFQYFYSNYPLINSRRLNNLSGEDVGVYACSTVIHGDTIDLYGCHWASNNYNEQHEREEVDNFDGIKNIKNICTASTLRKKEAEAIVREMSNSSHSAIVMGDMNDVGGSPALKILESEGLKDAWWEGGVGYGATIFKPLPYRIDHILFSKGLSLGTISVLDSKGISDHNALFAEFIVE